MHKSVAEVDLMAVRAPPSLFFTIIHPHLLFNLASLIIPAIPNLMHHFFFMFLLLQDLKLY
jgi:hypothetical protein